MADLNLWMQQIETLTPDERQEFLFWLDLRLQQKIAAAKGHRIPGVFAGKGFYMSDDFDAELPDEFWNFDEDFDL